MTGPTEPRNYLTNPLQREFKCTKRDTVWLEMGDTHNIDFFFHSVLLQTFFSASFKYSLNWKSYWTYSSYCIQVCSLPGCVLIAPQSKDLRCFLRAQWFAIASELRKQQREWNPPTIQGTGYCCCPKNSLCTQNTAKQKGACTYSLRWSWQVQTFGINGCKLRLKTTH